MEFSFERMFLASEPNQLLNLVEVLLYNLQRPHSTYKTYVKYMSLNSPIEQYCLSQLIFVCAGCKLGEASDFIVRQGTLIQVPSSAGEVGCYKICSCGQSGLLENCMEMHCIDLQKSCIVGGKRKSES